ISATKSSFSAGTCQSLCGCRRAGSSTDVQGRDRSTLLTSDRVSRSTRGFFTRDEHGVVVGVDLAGWVARQCDKTRGAAARLRLAPGAHSGRPVEQLVQRQRATSAGQVLVLVVAETVVEEGRRVLVAAPVNRPDCAADRSAQAFG